MKFGVGVIGATGYIATPYRAEIRAAADQASIVALCARRRDLLEAAGKEDGATCLTDEWRKVVDHPDVNVVLIATPDALHYEPAMACAAAGKHIICEKPVAMNAAEAQEIWTAFRDRKLGHFVPFWTRYVSIVRRTREIVRQGTIGGIRGVVCRWHNPRPASMPFTWRDDARQSAAGSLADVGSHVYDTLRWMLGLDAKRVLVHADVITPAKPDLGPVNLGEALKWGEANAAGATGDRRRGTAFDFADVAMVFENGAVGSLLLSHAPFFRKGLAPDLELHGDEASLAVDRSTGRITLARPGRAPEVIETIAETGFGNRFAQHVFPALRSCMAGDASDHPGLDDGWQVQRFTDAAVESARNGAWVEVI